MKTILKKSLSTLLAIFIFIIPIMSIVDIDANAASVYKYKIFIDNHDYTVSGGSAVSLMIKSVKNPNDTKRILISPYSKGGSNDFTRDSDVTITGTLDDYPGYFPYGLVTYFDILGFSAITVEYTAHLYIYDYSTNAWAEIASGRHSGKGALPEATYEFIDCAPSSFLPGGKYAKITPTWYNFKTDSYGFVNQSDLIPYAYFKTMYGAAKGWGLWKNEGYQSGVCFGMTYTTAAFNNDLPGCTSVRSLSRSTEGTIGNNSLTVNTYIRYAHIYQFSMEFSGNSHWSTAQEIYNIVKNCAEDNNIMCTIGMSHSSQGGHRVLAVGIEGNDILIDDPNNSEEYERLTVNPDGTWSFSGLNGWGSRNCRIRYSLDISAPYKFIKSLKPLTANDAFINDTTINSFTVSPDEILSKDYLLLSVDSDNYSIKNTDINKIESVEENEENTQSEVDLYWVGTDNTVNIEDLSENAEISLSGNEKIINIDATDIDTATLTVDEENNELNACMNSTAGKEYEISINDFTEDEMQTFTVSGKANGDEIILTASDDIIKISGLNDVVLQYEADGSIKETEININDGSDINVTIDDENNIYAEWTCTHSDADNNNVCDNCNEALEATPEDVKCSHMCHSSNGFLQFIWTIINFFSELFGINPVCECGTAHY